MGDTLSVDCQKMNLNLRLDLRMILNTEQRDIEAMTGEAASRRPTSASKLYNDRLKSTLATKCHLNKLLSHLPYIPPSKVSSIYIPIIQIMGLICTIYALSILDKQVYGVQVVSEFVYPRTTNEIRNDYIGKLLTGLHQVNVMMGSLENALANYSRDTSNAMKSITGNQKSRPLININSWTSEVIWYKDGKDGNDDDDEEE
ncbi:hypothetical protein BC941DRAFT_443976 [Chlamydoabsidia padenii]|nr:hypothetical protein BC941DRAFT_443976 [Chlamydoabsidia padenii]